MSKVLDRLRQHGPAGIPLADAQRLFLWMFCVTDVLPFALIGEALTKEALAEIFSNLVVEGVVARPTELTGEMTSPGAWLHLVDSFLSGRIALDRSFFDRARAYLAC